MPPPRRTHCASCAVELSDENAARSTSGQRGFRTRCRLCQNGRVREANPVQVRVCPICGERFVLTGRPPIDPEDGRWRGVLCRACRRGVLELGADPARLRAAAEYLEQDC